MYSSASSDPASGLSMGHTRDVFRVYAVAIAFLVLGMVIFIAARLGWRLLTHCLAGRQPGELSTNVEYQINHGSDVLSSHRIGGSASKSPIRGPLMVVSPSHEQLKRAMRHPLHDESDLRFTPVNDQNDYEFSTANAIDDDDVADVSCWECIGFVII